VTAYIDETVLELAGGTPAVGVRVEAPDTVARGEVDGDEIRRNDTVSLPKVTAEVGA
jgi:hypothetical protein